MSGEVAYSEIFWPGRGWMAGITVALALILVGSAILWRQLQQPSLDLPPTSLEVEIPPAPLVEPPPDVRHPRNPVKPRVHGTGRSLVARAGWEYKADSVSRAIRVEARRGDDPVIDILRDRTTALAAVPRANEDGRSYRRYRVTLLAAENQIWGQIFRQPRQEISDRANVLRISLSRRRLPKADSHRLRFEGETASGWQTLGHIIVKAAGQ